jgi:(p)ppGpp synthase/HD superfamily hydrolase
VPATKPSSRAGKSNTGHRPKLAHRFNKALLFASKMHAHQSRKGTGVPYIAHLLGVGSLVLEAGGDEDLAIAALLHDVVEDCGGAPALAQVRRHFGGRVARIVDGCTDSYDEPKPPWRERKEQFLQKLRAADHDIRLVAVADKLYNARSIVSDYREIGESIWQRFSGGREGTLWYYRALLDELRRAPNRLTEELERVVTDLEELTGERSRGRPHAITGKRGLKPCRV